MGKELDRFIQGVEGANVREALTVVRDYSGFQGDDHIRWMVDQTMRKLLGEERYHEFVRLYDEEADDEGYTLWDGGIAP